MVAELLLTEPDGNTHRELHPKTDQIWVPIHPNLLLLPVQIKPKHSSLKTEPQTY